MTTSRVFWWKVKYQMQKWVNKWYIVTFKECKLSFLKNRCLVIISLMVLFSSNGMISSAKDWLTQWCLKTSWYSKCMVPCVNLCTYILLQVVDFSSLLVELFSVSQTRSFLVKMKIVNVKADQVRELL